MVKAFQLGWRPAGMRASLLTATLAALLVFAAALPAQADTITTQLNSYFNVVTSDITSHPIAFATSPVAQNDYANGIVAADMAIVDLVTDPADVQKEFQIAVNDYNGVLLALGLPPLPGTVPAPEPSSLIQLGLGTAALALVLYRRHRLEILRRAECVRAAA